MGAAVLDRQPNSAPDESQSDPKAVDLSTFTYYN